MIFDYISTRLGVLGLLIVTGSASAQTVKNPQIIPGVCEEDRFYATPTTSDGQKLRFFTDTGGGLFLTAQAAQRLKLAMVDRVIEGEKISGVKLPAWRSEEASIPVVAQSDNVVPVLDPGTPGAKDALYQNIDGLLGANWFAQRIWTFDYPGGRLLLRAPGDVPAHDAGQEVRLGFQVDAATGQKTSNFPRITIRVDGQEINLLLDTGASTQLTETAHKQLHDDRPVLRATSFITATIFARWHEHHPDWPVIEAAEVGTSEAMIKVPNVEIAAHQVGPVWFTRRADKNFREGMSKWMDKAIDGSLGGNALGHFRLTVSYPDALAIFESR